MRRTIFKHTAIYSVAAVLGKVAGFVLLPFYAAVFSTEGYGVIGMLDAAVSLLAILLSRGFSTGVVRLYYDERANRHDEVVSTAIWLTNGFALVLLPIPLLCSGLLGRVLTGRPDYGLLVALSLVSTAVDMSGTTASVSLIVRQRSITYSMLGLFRLFLQIGLNILLVFVWHLRLTGVFVASLATALLLGAIFHVIAIREHGLAFDRGTARQLAAFQLPLIPGDLVSFVSRQIERVLVRVLMNINAVGVLEMAYKFPPLLGLFITQPFLRTWRSKSMEIAGTPDAPIAMGQVFTGYAFVMASAATLLAVNIDPVLRMLTPREFWSASGIARVETVTTVLVGLTSFMEFGLLYRKRTALLTSITAAVSIVKIALSYALISAWHLQGAAYSACVAAAITLVAVGIGSQRAYPIVFERAKLTLTLCGTVALAAVVPRIDWAAAVSPDVRSRIGDGLAAGVTVLRLAQWKQGRLLEVTRTAVEPMLALCLNTLTVAAALGAAVVMSRWAGTTGWPRPTGRAPMRDLIVGVEGDSVEFNQPL